MQLPQSLVKHNDGNVFFVNILATEYLNPNKEIVDLSEALTKLIEEKGIKSILKIECFYQNYLLDLFRDVYSYSYEMFPLILADAANNFGYSNLTDNIIEILTGYFETLDAQGLRTASDRAERELLALNCVHEIGKAIIKYYRTYKDNNDFYDIRCKKLMEELCEIEELITKCREKQEKIKKLFA